MRKKLTLDHIGESEYLRLLEVGYNGEKPEYYILEETDNSDIRNHGAEYQHTCKIFWHKPEYDEELKNYRRYIVYQRKPKWQFELLKVVDKYSSVDDIPIEEAIQAVYTKVKSSFKNEGEFRFSVNGDTSHLLDMNEFMTRVVFPIEDIKGDVYYFYSYLDHFVIIKEFIHNRIYVLDMKDFKTKCEFDKLIEQEKKICTLTCKFIRRKSQMTQVSIASDEERIKILLDPDASKEMKDKARGISK